MSANDDRRQPALRGIPISPGAFRLLKVLFVIVGLVLLFVILSVAKGLWVQWLWFDDLGYKSVFSTMVTTRLWMFFAGAFFFAFALLINLWVANRLARQELPSVLSPEVDARLRSLTTPALVLLTILLSAIFGSTFSGRWEDLLLFSNSEPFGIADPQFHRDVSFYTFRLPFYSFLQNWLLGIIILVFILTFAYYAVRVSLHSGRFRLSQGPKAHLLSLGAVALLLLFFRFWVNIYELVYSSHGASFGASFTEVHARIPGLRILMGATLVVAGALVASAFFYWGTRLVIGVLIGWVVALIALVAVYPAIVQRFTVQPAELLRETPYLQRSIDMTRYAYGLDRIQETDFPAADALSAQDIADNPQTVTNVRLWDPPPLLTTYNQIQSIRLQYAFNDVDVDRYRIEGKYRQVMLSARELDIANLPPDANSWINRHIVFTHGYGVAMSPVNEISPEGLPTLFIKDVPPVGTVNEPSLEIKRPEVYFGERTSQYVIVGTDEKEFDYSKGEDNVYGNVFAANAPGKGVQLSSVWRRLALSWDLGDLNILFASQIKADSRIRFYRKIRDRVARIAPFLFLDRDPYLVIDHGQLYWIIDAYTTTDRFPYSEPYVGKLNYIRNSVKVVVNAFDGATNFYVVQPDDPVLQAYSSIFPHLFRPVAELPGDLREHFRYPEGLFEIQTEKYLAYHMKTPQVFYNREDLYNQPQEKFIDRPVRMEAYYVIMRVPGEQREEFLLMLPFTPAGGKHNTVAWMAARSDGDNYGKLLVFRFPKDKLVFGPFQIESRIDQDTTISAQLSLWNQAGSKVIRGNLLMIPIDKGFLYVEPLYLQATDSALPELKRVVVANGNRLVMDVNLERSLEVLFGLAPPSLPETPSVPGGGQPGGLTPDQSLRLQQQIDSLRRSLQELESTLHSFYPTPTPTRAAPG